MMESSRLPTRRSASATPPLTTAAPMENAKPMPSDSTGTGAIRRNTAARMMATAATRISSPSIPEEKNSTLWWPRAWSSSGGLAAIRSAMNPKLAASRFTTDSAASEKRPTDPVTRHAVNLSAMVVRAAPTDSSIIRCLSGTPFTDGSPTSRADATAACTARCPPAVAALMAPHLQNRGTIGREQDARCPEKAAGKAPVPEMNFLRVIRPDSVGKRAEGLPRDHQALDFAGALVDLLDPRVPVVPLDRELVDVAVAAVDLDRAITDALRGLAGEELGHGGLAGEGALGLLQRGRAKAEQLRDREIGLHIRQELTDGPEVRDGLAEGVAVLGVADRGRQRGPRDPDGLT